MNKFQEKVVIVAGGGSGIGAATAVAAAREGASVVIADINAEASREVARYIQDLPGKAITVIADTTKINDAQRITQEAITHFGGVDFLCNSVGLQTYGTVIDMEEDSWDKTIDVNLKSIFLVSKFAIPEITRRGGGAVVNISSVQGIRCQPNVSAYAASKGAVIAMTRSMAQDFARQNVRVNCICPGSIDTPLLRYGAAQHGDLDTVLQQWGDNHPIGRIGTPEEIAATVLFLFGKEAGFILGQPIVADGGLSIGIL